ncbi:MAG: thiamine phosphate synthase [Hyphomonadaceae bacterium]
MGRAVLIGLAQRLNREAGAKGLPPLLFLIDRERTPDPLGAAARLPRGAGVIYRHFGAADRLAAGRALARLCRRRGLTLLIGGDAALARALAADGVHLPERLVALARSLPTHWLVTAAAHSRGALARAKAAGVDAALLSLIFPSNSPSAARALGPLKAGRLAKAAGLPVYALGGVNARTGARLIGRGFAGVAAVEALA